MDNPDRLTRTERRATMALASVFSLRMLGLFMLLPVLSLFAEDYQDYTPTLAGLAIGIYGLTQAMLQIPAGMLSDRIGRKPVILGGLLLFTFGSIVAALATSLAGVIIGRALQGAGAIAAAVMALAADLTREEHRTKAMAVIGASIGMAFALALIVGPIAGARWGLGGLFWITALLGIVAMVILRGFVPQAVHMRFHRDTEPVPSQLLRILGDGQLLRLDVGIFVLHLILTASFMVVPLALRNAGALPAQHWQIYLFVLIASVVLMAPLVVFAERFQRTKQVFIGAVLVTGLSQAGLALFHDSLVEIVSLLVCFFTGLNVLEASLPSLISRLAPSEMKGTALGVYATSQFFGAFIGGVMGGWLYGASGMAAVFGTCALMAGGWCVIALSMRNPRSLSSHMVNLGTITEDEASKTAAQLAGVTGVAEAVVIVEDGIAYLKVDRKTLDEESLRRFSVAEA